MGRFIVVDNIQIELIRKKGKKNLSLKLNQKTRTPEVSIPYFCPIFIAKSFVEKHIIWLKKHLQMKAWNMYSL